MNRHFVVYLLRSLFHPHMLKEDAALEHDREVLRLGYTGQGVFGPNIQAAARRDGKARSAIALLGDRILGLSGFI